MIKDVVSNFCSIGKKILKADLVHLDETSIEDSRECNIEIEGFHSHYVSAGNGKGIATFRRVLVNGTTIVLKLPTLQIVKISMDEIDSVNVYRSSSHSAIETFEALKNMIDPKRPTIVTGDFNVCYRKNEANAITAGLVRNGFSQLQTEASHMRGGVIDHVYWSDPTKNWNQPIFERHSVYYSDHDVFLISLSKKPAKRSKLSKRAKNKKQKVI